MSSVVCVTFLVHSHRKTTFLKRSNGVRDAPLLAMDMPPVYAPIQGVYSFRTCSRRYTLTSLRCRNGARRVFTDQANIACNKREAGGSPKLSKNMRGGGNFWSWALDRMGSSAKKSRAPVCFFVSTFFLCSAVLRGLLVCCGCFFVLTFFGAVVFSFCRVPLPRPFFFFPTCAFTP